jgi:hypothetical protein
MININSQRKATNKYLFIIAGESNSGGRGLNSQAISNEIGVRNNVQILNNYSLSFQTLNIGVNNILNHAGADINNNGALSDPTWSTTRHGFELQLANLVDNNTSFYKDSIFLVKTGQGGSIIADWLPSASNAWGVTSFYTQFQTRINTALTYFNNNNITVTPIILFSLGINDAIAVTDVNTFKSNLLTVLNNYRSVVGSNTPIIMTEFQAMSAYSSYSNAINQIANSINNTYSINTTGFGLDDANHWSYTGLKSIVNSMKPIFDNF